MIIKAFSSGGIPKLKLNNGKIPDKFIFFNEALRTKN